MSDLAAVNEQSISEQLTEAAELVAQDRCEENPTHLYAGDTTVRYDAMVELLRLTEVAANRLEELEGDLSLAYRSLGSRLSPRERYLEVVQEIERKAESLFQQGEKEVEKTYAIAIGRVYLDLAHQLREHFLPVKVLDA